MNKPAVTQAQALRMVDALTKRGLNVAGVRCWPDGRVDILTGDAASPSLPPVDDGGWEAHERRHGHG